MKKWRNSVLPWVILTALCFSGSAGADSVGEAGELVSIELLAPSSDDFSAYHGTLVLRQQSDGTDQQYRWGGAACPGKDLDEAQENRLFELASAPYMLITPYYKPGAGSNLCIVGFVASNRKFF